MEKKKIEKPVRIYEKITTNLRTPIILHFIKKNKKRKVFTLKKSLMKSLSETHPVKRHNGD